jgi:hypothetical protein
MAGIPQKHDPGGKVRLAIPLDVKDRSAKPHAMFIMMNPSVADQTWDDRSVAKCCRFARTWEYGGIYLGNTFAYVAADKKRLSAIDPIDPENDRHLIEIAKLDPLIETRADSW